MADEALARKLIGRYLEERRDEAVSRLGAPEAKGSAERAWEKWWSTGELDRETAARVLLWATDRARQASGPATTSPTGSSGLSSSVTHWFSGWPSTAATPRRPLHGRDMWPGPHRRPSAP